MTPIAINLLSSRLPSINPNGTTTSAMTLMPDGYHGASIISSDSPIAPSHSIFRPEATKVSALVRQGAIQAVDNCAKIQKGELTVIVTDRETLSSAEPIAQRAEAVGSNVAFFIMEDFGKRSEDGSNPLQLPPTIKRALSVADVSFLIAQSKPGELESFRKPLVMTAISHGLRHAHMPGFTKEMMWMGMAADYKQIQRLSQKVHTIVSQAKKIRVTSPAGTDAVFFFDQKHRWVVCDGHIRKGSMGNLPGGEVFTTPACADGIVVIDLGFGDFFSSRYGNISSTPLTYKLSNGRCVRESILCKNQSLKNDFLAYTFESDKNANRVGEFAIGTNIALNDFIGNILQDEKLPGVHIALGSPLPIATGATWDSTVHNDGIIKNPSVWVDDFQLINNGLFSIT